MDAFKRLEAAIRLQSDEGELPDFLRQPLLSLVANPERFMEKSEILERLIHQVENFDTYAGAGCFADSYGPEDILKTLMQLTVDPT